MHGRGLVARHARELRHERIGDTMRNGARLARLPAAARQRKDIVLPQHTSELERPHDLLTVLRTGKVLAQRRTVHQHRTERRFGVLGRHEPDASAALLPAATGIGTALLVNVPPRRGAQWRGALFLCILCLAMRAHEFAKHLFHLRRELALVRGAALRKRRCLGICKVFQNKRAVPQ